MKYFSLKTLKSRPTPQSGQAIMIAIIFFLAVSLTIVLGVSNPVLKQVKVSSDLIRGRESFFLAEAGVEDVTYRIRTNKAVSYNETLVLGGGTVNTTIEDIPTNKKQVTSTSDIYSGSRTIQTELTRGTGVSFHYGIQAGRGGFRLYNSSSVTGNVHSSGPIIGAGNSSNWIYGDAVSAGPSGIIYGIHATGTVFSNTVGHASQTTTIDKDVYYMNLVGTVIASSTLMHPNSPDQPYAAMPIPDSLINQWESQAEAGGILDSSACDSYATSTNTCTIDTSRSLGPKKIPFNLLVKTSSGILTVTGPLWVTGNITTQTGPTIRMSPSLGSQNVAVIADNPADRLNSSIIEIGQTTVFEGSGAPGSFVFMISQNNSAENGGNTDAIEMSQGAAALVAYAGHGQVTLSQSVSVKEVTAYKIILTQSANVIYDTGLPSTVFSSGPSGGYDILKWKEIE